MSAPTQKNIHTGELANGTAKTNGHGRSAPGEYIKWLVASSNELISTAELIGYQGR